ncbi:MAG: glycogen synthase GlgA [Candidatus Omnitrophota bacterium]|jgi:starch synthase
MKIAICASEVVPFAKTGGLADVAGALPQALEAAGQEVIVIMPGYKAIRNLKSIKISKSKSGMAYSIIGENVKVYFVENEQYFNRDGLYGDKAGDYPDNLDRFSYYSRRAIGLLKEVNFKADIIHCHDWQSALIPVYLKNLYANDPFYKAAKTIVTIHNMGYQGLFAKAEFPKLGLDWSLFNMEMLEFFDKVNILKGGIVFSDFVTTVSPTYSREIRTKEFGFGLEGVLSKRGEAVLGILNGLDYNIWNPEKDTFLKAVYAFDSIQRKAENKKDLQGICKLPLKDDVPLVGIVSRLAEQKGFDILAQAIDKICKMNLQLVILGTGDLKYHQILEAMVKKYPKVISLQLKFDDTLAHKIYAGSDIFLMPSKYEPCGLGQLISLRYGTIPLVFKTGGLADTVTPQNGFIFDEYSPAALIATLKKATAVFKLKKKWLALIEAAMHAQFAWENSAKKYVQLYKKACASA